MKKLPLLIIFASVFGLLLSSCSRLKDITITKRHYRSGFYVDLGGSDRNTVTPTTSQKSKSFENSIASASVKTAPVVAVVQDKQDSKSISVPEHLKVKKKSAVRASANTYASTENISEVRENMESANLQRELNSLPDIAMPASSSEDAPMWAIILFAILIPPLGVGLKFGIVDKFWISLVLTLLFWLPGAIYSVIVVTAD